MKKRYKLTSLALSVVMLLSVLQIAFAYPSITAVTTQNISITSNGEEVSDITLPESEKLELRAESELAMSDYQWQILADEQSGLWVDIMGATNTKLSVTYALLSSVMNENSAAFLRFCAKGEDGASLASKAVSVKISYEPVLAQANNTIFNAKAATSDIEPSYPLLNLSNDDQMVTVTIKYLFYEGKEKVFEPYTAQIQKGASFEKAVSNPAFVGYDAYLADESGNLTLNENGDPTTEKCTEVQFNEANVQSDITKTVYYLPALVNYGVRFLFQNISNDLYTEKTDLYHTHKAKTGTVVSTSELQQHAGDVDGYRMLYHYPEAVAADGSTVFECYYDRRYYLLKFDLDGGYGTDPVYARYETPFLVNTPERKGYTFEGWLASELNEDGTIKKDENGNTIYSENVVDLPTAVPANNMEYKAKWSTAETSFTVVYWLENADSPVGATDENVKYDYWCSYTVAKNSGETVKGDDYKVIPDNLKSSAGLDEHELRYSEFDHCDKEVTVNGDGSTVLNVYYKRKDYTLKFYYAATKGDDENKQTYIVGGSTYGFGANHSSPSNLTGDDRKDVNKLLSQYLPGGDLHDGYVGTVTDLPQIKTGYKGEQGFQELTVNDEVYKFHCLSFTAKYGSDISELWPCDVIGSTERTDISTNTNNWNHTTAFVSAWNGEDRVEYSKSHDNETIKGKYTKLDYQLLFRDPNEELDENNQRVVSYLCFWENGCGGVGWNVPKLFRYNIYVQTLSAAAAGQDDINTESNYELLTSYDTCDNSSFDEQTPPAIQGFTYKQGKETDLTNPDSTQYQSSTNCNFYYTRNKYNFVSKNHSISNDREVVYGAKLYEIPEENVGVEGLDPKKPKYPNDLEPNAYTFDNWYTSPQHLSGTEFSFDNATMPAHNVSIYANWKPNVYSVVFFEDVDKMESYKNATDKDNIEQYIYTSGTNTYKKDVTHGNVFGSVQEPQRDGYDFGGWFYIDNTGRKKPFAPNDEPVRSDLLVFADWISNESQPFTMHYALESKVNSTNPDFAELSQIENPVENKEYTIVTGTNTSATYIYLNGGFHRVIANPYSGHAFLGRTRTFTPKAGEDLFTGYQTGYYPTLASHSITIAREENDEAQKNVFTFLYTMKNEVKYTVRYFDAGTGAPIIIDGKPIEAEPKSSTLNIVTEKFKQIDGYVPSTAYQTLVLSSEEELNVITFYYTKTDNQAIYTIHYMLEDSNGTNNFDGKNFTEQTLTVDGICNLNDTITHQPKEYNGYKLYEKAKNATSDPQNVALVVTDSTEEVYKDLNSDSFTFTINKNGTDIYIYYSILKYNFTVKYLDWATGEALEKTKVINNVPYGTVITETAPSIDGKVLYGSTSQTKTVMANESLNVITFYYTDIKYQIEYKVIGGKGGSLSIYGETTESTDDATGSTPTADEGYSFIGWYTDENCTQKVANEYVGENNKLTPVSSELDPAKMNIFYALFDYKVVFHENLPTANATNLDKIFRTYSKNDPNAEFNLTSENKIEAFYDIPELENYVFAGWYTRDDNALIETADGDSFTYNAINWDTTTYEKETHIYAKWIPIGDVNADSKDDKLIAPLDNGYTYKDFDLVGTEIRNSKYDSNYPNGTADDKNFAENGLRFIGVISEKLLKEVDSLKPADSTGNYIKPEYGFVMSSESNADKFLKQSGKLRYKGLDNGEDTNSSYKFVKNYNCTSKVGDYSTQERPEKDHRNFQDYRLYTLVVTYKTDNNKGNNLITRPYLRYTDANGLTRTFYRDYSGESKKYGGCCTSYSAVSDIVQKICKE